MAAHLTVCRPGCEWCECDCHLDGAGTWHVFPVNDLIEHDTSGEQDCLCGPDTEHVPNPNGPDGWVVKHHSLDGREHHEETR